MVFFAAPELLLAVQNAVGNYGFSPVEKSKERFVFERHAKYFGRYLKLMPEFAQQGDCQRMTMVFFALSALDLLGVLDKTISGQKRAQFIDWIYSLQVVPDIKGKETNPGRFGFQGARDMGSRFNPECEPVEANLFESGHLAMTYTALASLAILGDNFGRVYRKEIIQSLRHYQLDDGSFRGTEDGEVDMRFVYCACAISYMLNDWSGINIDKAVDFITKSQGYDGGIAQEPGSESHGSFAFCAISSLYMMGRLNAISTEKREELLGWLLMRQESGFQGRPHKPVDTCYSWWVGSTIYLLGEGALINTKEIRSFLFQTQNTISGGFAKHVDALPDLLHSYMGISGLSLQGELGIRPVHPALNISMKASRNLTYRRCLQPITLKECIAMTFVAATIVSGSRERSHIAISFPTLMLYFTSLFERLLS
eukprot:m.58852 g.58852  ORF g.58852 m.58852 type:complete len:425 (-) comp11203_c0_seq1:19-1293(-)